ncbi:hypothetical protein CBR_g20249 [Chara braunii]|uniref:BTB domain-containing protein n=1 Tax=Chara braunii TaxID=69332 RepID=A0A388KZY6_CHABU|nr:hypothetical protein CBR_g20249 [Chara braunii]|eukprot:GBG75619.1 hypothetical protein CBR_g20249 [Chara braunii]
MADQGSSLQKKRKNDGREGVPYHTEQEEKNAEHEQEVLSVLRTILGREQLLDLTFVCEDGKAVRANRALLASWSEYFLKLLHGDMKERSMDRIPLPNAKAGGLQIVVSYMHGRPFRWGTDSCWDDMVEAYCLTAQYQIDSLCERILLLVRSLVHARELGDLLNAAIPRQAEEVLRAAVKVMNDILALDSTSFLGWAKESITYCLENMIFPPNVTETMVVEAVLSAASYDCTAGVEQENACMQSEMAASAAKEFDPAVSKLRRCSQSAKPLTKCDAEGGHSLSRKNLQEILEYHINLAFVDPLFVNKRIEPLGILRPEVLTAVYRVHAICCSRGFSTKSMLALPWRSLSTKVSFARFKVGQDGIHKSYTEVLLPSPWDCVRGISSGIIISEEQPHRVRCTGRRSEESTEDPLRMNLPLVSGKHIWMVRSLSSCMAFGVGVASSNPRVIFHLQCFSMGRKYWLWKKTDEKRIMQDMSEVFPDSFSLERFNRCGATLFVILDITKRSLTFADKLERYMNREGEYPAAFVELPCDTALYPSFCMTSPGYVEIEWIQSSPCAQLTRPHWRMCVVIEELISIRLRDHLRCISVQFTTCFKQQGRQLEVHHEVRSKVMGLNCIYCYGIVARFAVSMAMVARFAVSIANLTVRFRVMQSLCSL